MIIAAFSYAVVAAIVKSIEGIPVYEKLFFRVAFGFVFMLCYTLKKEIPIRGVNHIGLVARGITGFIAAFFYYLSISKIFLADAVTISNLYPFIVIILSAIALKEKIRSFHIAASMLGFLGALMMIRPGFTEINHYYFYALVAAVFTGITYTILKHVRKTDSCEVVVLYYSFISAVACIPFMLFLDFKVPTGLQLAQLISLGLAGSIYQWFVTSAYKYAPAGEVSIYSFSSIIFSCFIGIFFWNEAPAAITILGMVSIIAGAYIIFKGEKDEETR